MAWILAGGFVAATVVADGFGRMVVLASASLCFALWDYSRHRDPFSPGTFGAVVFLLYYPVRAMALVLDQSPHTYPMFRGNTLPLLERSVGIASVGFLAWATGYSVRWGKPLVRALGSLRLVQTRITPTGVSAVLVAGCVARLVLFNVGSTAYGTSVPLALRSTASLLADLPHLSVAIAAHQFATNVRTRGSLWVLFLANFVTASVGSSKTAVILSVLSIVIPLHYAGRQFRFRTAIVGVLALIFVVLPVGSIYRQELQDRSKGTTTTRVEFDNLQTYSVSSARQASARLSGMEAVAAASELTPDVVPFRGGRALVLIPLQFMVPRLLWSEKPEVGGTREFAKTYLRLEEKAISGVAVTPIADLWIVGGWFAVAAGMAFLGQLASMLYRSFDRGMFLPLRGPAWFVVLFNIVNWELAFDAVVLKALRSVSLLIIMLLLCGYRFSYHRRVHRLARVGIV